MDNGDIVIYKPRKFSLFRPKYKAGIYCEYFNAIVSIDKKRGLYIVREMPEKYRRFKCTGLAMQYDMDRVERAIIRGMHDNESFIVSVSRKVSEVGGCDIDSALLRVLFRGYIPVEKCGPSVSLEAILGGKSNWFYEVSEN